MSDQEIEIKFYVNDLKKIQSRLLELGAELVQPRVFEANLRFDTPDGLLARSFQVLRLRLDSAARLTFKGPSQMQDGVRIRREIEFIVEDFSKARTLLEALGYQVSMIYEKYRAIFDLDGVHITLDEMPYGSFIELEGPNIAALQSVNQKLDLDWTAGVPASYPVLFDQLRVKKQLAFRDLSFENFLDIQITADEMGIRAAD